MNIEALKDLIKRIEEEGKEADKVNIAGLPWEDVSRIVTYNRTVNELVNTLAGEIADYKRKMNH